MLMGPEDGLAGASFRSGTSANPTDNDGLKTARVVHQSPEAERPSEAQTEHSVSMFRELIAADRGEAEALLAQNAIIDQITTAVRAVAAKINQPLQGELAAALHSNQTSLQMGGHDFFNLIRAELQKQGGRNGVSRILDTKDYREHEVLMIAVAMACIELINSELASDQGMTKRLSGTLVNQMTPELRTDGRSMSGLDVEGRTGVSFRFEFVDSSAPVPRASGHSAGFILQAEPLASDLNEYIRAQQAIASWFDQL